MHWYTRSVAAFEYDSTYPIRDDLPAAHREFWSTLAAAGTWWTGAQRVAIADQVRRAAACDLCARRKAALSPYAVEGEHDEAGPLSKAAVDAVHRVTTDPCRLSKAWFDGQIEAGLTDGQHVELVAIVSSLVSIDGFHRALGLPLEPLPQAQAGEPSEVRPEGLVDGVAWVPVIDPKKTAEAEADLFSNDRPGHIAQALSLVPADLRVHKRLHAVHYLPYDRVAIPGYAKGRALQRVQIELVAARVSALSECFY